MPLLFIFACLAASRESLTAIDGQKPARCTLEVGVKKGVKNDVAALTCQLHDWIFNELPEPITSGTRPYSGCIDRNRAALRRTSAE